MTEEHPFTIEICPRDTVVRQFGWTIYAKGERRDVSASSYATKREANFSAGKAMQRLIANWRDGKANAPRADSAIDQAS